MPRPAASDRHWPAHDPYSSSGELSDPPHERPPISKTQKLLTRLSRNKDQTAHPSPAHHPELRRGTYPGESIHRDTNSHLPHEQFEVDERQHFIPGQDWRGTSEKKKWSKMRIVGIVMGVIFLCGCIACAVLAYQAKDIPKGEEDLVPRWGAYAIGASVAFVFALFSIIDGAWGLACGSCCELCGACCEAISRN